MTDISEKKALLRKRLRSARASIANHTERSRKACANLTRVPGWPKARNVLVYVAYRSELETDSLIQTLLNDPGKRCVVPQCLPTGRLKLVEIRSLDELSPGAYGIPEPRPDVSGDPARIRTPREIDFAVLPGVGFDEKGRRLGQGGGYYDRLLPAFRRETAVAGLAFECQILPEICVESHDLGVQYVVTEERILVGRTPRVWGIVGGIACGKSFVSNFFREHGIPVFDADQFGHSLYERADVQKKLTERWGGSVLTPDGAFDRKKIAQIVFAPAPDGEKSPELIFLDNLFHPLVRRGWTEFCENARREGEKAVILDAPLLLETGWQTECDRILFVDAPRGVQIQFAKKRGWSLEQLEARERNQFPILEKRKAADFVVANTGGEETPLILKQYLKIIRDEI